MIAFAQMNAAVTGGNLEAAKILVHCHSELLHHRDSNGSTWLHGAARHGQPEMIAWLCSQGLDPNAENENSLTPIWIAQSANQMSAARALLDAGANPNHCVNGEPLITSVIRTFGMHNELQWLNLLFDHGANVHQGDRDQRSHLQHAALQGNAEVCILLIRHGADKDAIDPVFGVDAIELARKWGNDAAADRVEAWLQAKAAQAVIDQLSSPNGIRALDAFRS